MNEYVEGRFTKEEKIDFNKFEIIAKQFPVMFANYKETEYGTPYDILNLTKTGGTYAIELKSRNKKYDTCYIEWDKFSKLRELWRNNQILPVYICFFENESYMWLLNEVSSITTYLNVKITPIKGTPYEGDRVGLKYEEAYHITYSANGKVIIEKPTAERFITNCVPTYRDKSILNNNINKYNYYKI